MRSGKLWISIGLATAFGAAACGDDVAAPAEMSSSFIAEVTGDYHRQLWGEARLTNQLELAEEFTDPDGRELAALILQEGIPSSGGTNIFFARQGTALDLGEYAVGDSYLGAEGDRKVLATFNEWLDGDRVRLHYAADGVLRVTESSPNGVSGTFRIRLGDWVVLDRNEARQDAADVPSGPSDLLVTGTFSATRR